MIHDTNALSAFAKGNQAVRTRIAESAGPFLPVIVLGEYRFGLFSIRDREIRIAWLLDLARHWTVLHVIHETAIRYAEIRQRLKEQATPIPANGAWIAALAHQHTLPVLSNDPHFDVVPGIQRISFPEAT
ncbi:MAG: PIN domain-containing protein [Verrucomicrobiota bacterium]|jgi:tRNA(fMet)-specific endonuclease VapC